MGLLSEGIGDDVGLSIVPKKDKAWIDAKLKTTTAVVKSTGIVLAASFVFLGGAIIYNARKKRRA